MKVSADSGRGFLVSVVVCTYSRERLDQLNETLESLVTQTYTPIEIVLVVDHNPSLSEELRRSVEAPISVVENANTRGLSGARNSGVERATGSVIAFIDDDAAAEPDWIERLVECYLDEGVLGAGGRIVPVWEGGKAPSWLPEEFLWIVGCTYRGMPERGQVRNLIGCNMSFRSSVFEAVGGFNSAVGRVGKLPVGCEETEFCIRATNHWPAGKILYWPEGGVLHHVPRSRQTPGYFLRRCYSEGTSKAVVLRLAGSMGTNTENTYLLKTLVPAVLRNAGSALTLKNPLSSLGRVGAITVGAAAVAIGLIIGMMRTLISRRP